MEWEQKYEVSYQNIFIIHQGGEILSSIRGIKEVGNGSYEITRILMSYIAPTALLG
jgi:hypothetical protein